MTDNQRRAFDYLNRYAEDAAQINFLEERCLVQRAKVERATSGFGSEMGWTGKWEGKSKITNQIIVVKDPTLVKKPKKVYAPVSQSGTHSGNQDLQMLLLIEREEELEDAMHRLEDLAAEMSDYIDQHCEQPGTQVLKLMYLCRKNYAGVAHVMNYSYSHVRKLHWDSLEEMGKSMGEEKISSNKL